MPFSLSAILRRNNNCGVSLGNVSSGPLMPARVNEPRAVALPHRRSMWQQSIRFYSVAWACKQTVVTSIPSSGLACGANRCQAARVHARARPRESFAPLGRKTRRRCPARDCDLGVWSASVTRCCGGTGFNQERVDRVAVHLVLGTRNGILALVGGQECTVYPRQGRCISTGPASRTS